VIEPRRRGYYDYPVVRRPVWTWEIPTYFWLGGIAGGAYATASLAERFGTADDRRYTADGFYLAAAAAVACPPLLIADLGRPERFHHMLRIFKPLSPMNLGAWVLAAFAPTAVVRAGRHAADSGRLSRPLAAIARLAPRAMTEIAGSLLGLALAGYTGVLLAATNVPLWAKSKLLGGLFMASALSSGSAGISLTAARRRAADTTLHRLGQIDRAAAVGEIAMLAGYLAQSGRAGRPLLSGRLAPAFWAGAAASTVIPLLLHGAAASSSGKTLRRLSTAAAASSLLGALALRWSIFEAGKPSSEDQRASFELSENVEPK
jgi:formate-dependent nitrite reductase membrane component NrfD